jgi:HTH-type transcriptional regulator/antitoxin HigA
MQNTAEGINEGIRMELKIINTEDQYKKSLAEVERLIALDPALGTPEADHLELLSKLVEIYEKEHFHFDLPDPIEAIRFRMEEQGLMQRDLVPYIGSKSKVSEILSGKRPLTLQMIRALNAGLDIPAEVLLRETNKAQNDKCTDIDWQQFPIAEMIKRGWITTRVRNVRKRAEEIMKSFLSPLSGKIPCTAVCRRTLDKHSDESKTLYALYAWAARVLIRAKNEFCSASYKPGIVTKAFLNEVARLSLFNQGPLLAKEFLSKNGIAFIIEPHLPGTRLDGGAMLTEEGWPVVALTLRYDRIDSFWYSLIHELSHIAKHLKVPGEIFIDDDLDQDVQDHLEKEADKLTREAFVPRSIWMRSDAYYKRTSESIKELAEELKIHPALIAGRIRRESNNYTILKDLIGQGEVRKFFIKN